jgi:uncharacterized protein (TIGR04255 family)
MLSVTMDTETKSEVPERIGRKYPHAPITEAIIELRVKPSRDVDILECRTAFDSVRSQFTDAKELRMMHAEFMGGQHVGAHATQSAIGYVLRSEEFRQVITASPDKFSFSQLPPYDSWEVFCPAVRRMWDLYVAKISPEKVIRVATRFVNRIEIPLPVTDLGEYFRTAPLISPKMSQELSGAFMQLQLPQKDIDCTVLLTEALLGAGDSTVAFVLDIDIFDESREFPVNNVIWERLNQFRRRKNEIFEACITDRVRDLIS